MFNINAIIEIDVLKPYLASWLMLKINEEKGFIINLKFYMTNANN